MLEYNSSTKSKAIISIVSSFDITILRMVLFVVNNSIEKLREITKRLEISKLL